MALYDDLGGEPAMSAALDRFYPKVLADPLISPFFDGVDMADLKQRALPFVVMAMGGPANYTGPGLRTIHSGPRRKGMTDEHFDAFVGHFMEVLTELEVDQERSGQIHTILQGARADVLGR